MPSQGPEPPEIDPIVLPVVVLAVMLLVGSCALRTPGRPGLSPLATGLAITAITLVVRYLGLGKLGCLGTLVVLAAAAQVMFS